VLRVATAASLTLCVGEVGGAEGPPEEKALRAIEERGRRISLYVQASEKGREVLRQSPQEVPPPDHVVVHEDRQAWRVLFLKDFQDRGVRKGLKVLAEVEYYPASGEAGMLRLMAPPRAASPLSTAFARALEEAVKAAAARGGIRAPYEEAVVREADGVFSVYLGSAPAGGGTVQFGADLLVRVASSGRQTISLEPLHAETTAVSAAPRGAGEPTLHVHPSGDLPAPTDVAQVLRRPALAPHLVLTPRFMFRIDAEGRITYLGPRPPPGPAASGGAR
jgi:hypothetical protein